MLKLNQYKHFCIIIVFCFILLHNFLDSFILKNLITNTSLKILREEIKMNDNVFRKAMVIVHFQQIDSFVPLRYR